MTQWSTAVDIVFQNCVVRGFHQVYVDGEERINPHYPEPTQVFPEEIQHQFLSNLQTPPFLSVFSVLECLAEAVHYDRASDSSSL